MYSLQISYTGDTTPYDIYTGTTGIYTGATLVMSGVTTFPATIGEFDVTQVYVFLQTQDCNPQMFVYNNNIPSPTPTQTPTFTVTPTNTVTPSISVSPTRTPTRTPPQTATNSSTPTLTPSPTESPAVSPSASLTRTPTPSVTQSRTPATTVTASQTQTPQATLTPTISVSPTQSISPSPSVSPSPVCWRYEIDATETFEVLTATYFDCYTSTWKSVDVYNGTPVQLDCVQEGSISIAGGTSYSIINLGGCSANVSSTPTATPTKTPTVTPTLTPTMSNTPTLTVTPTPSLSLYVTPSPSAPSNATCSCPDGYEPNINGTECVSIQTQPATAPTSPESLVARTFSSYGNFGALLYSTYNTNGTWIDPPTAITSSSFWINSGSTNVDGPMNRTAVWSATPQSNQDVGFSTCFNVATTQTFYIGMGADNSARITLDGVTILNQDVSTMAAQLGSDAQIAFKYWFIYPVTMTAGQHIMEVIGHNVSSVAGVGIEIYNNTATEIKAATSYAGLNIFFTSANKVGDPVDLGNGGIGYTCPAGWSLVTCDGGTPYCQLTQYTSCQPPG
jgi:hypothetical protein